MVEGTSLDRLVENIFIHSSPFFQSKRGLILDPLGSTLIDTPVALEESQRLFRFARESGQPIRRIVLTHSHFDHTTGCQFLLEGERISQQGAGEWMLGEAAREYLALDPPEHPDLKKFTITLPSLEICGSATLRSATRSLHLFPTPGHSPDSMSVWVEPERILFTGDAVVTCFPPVIEDGNSADTVESYQKILALDFQWLVPGHGPVLDGQAARRHIRTSLFYIEEMKKRLYRFSNPDSPMEEIEADVSDLISVFPSTLNMVPEFHRLAVSKMWNERKAELLENERRGG
jgi:glyoxylase-like metal-dependent hydrolase (beta-lactamase superfamily II)